MKTLAAETRLGGDILVVDDLPENLDVLSTILRRSGHRVRLANNGRLALRIAGKLPPELILLDINMPEMDGYEVCHRLKDDEATKDIPVIFVSALDGVFDKVGAFEAGGVDYVVKPFQAEEVLARVATQLEIGRLQRELQRRNRELERRNRDLQRSQKKVELVFSALSEVLPGMEIDGKYRVDRQIGSGGFGAVYEATHLHLERKVAIKVFQPISPKADPESFERFRREGASASRVRHPNAVQVLDSGVSEHGIAYLVMEMLKGESLRDLLKDRKRLSSTSAVNIVLPVAEVLAFADEAGLIHRDIKPENIFLHRSGDGEVVVKVVDFGIAKMLESEDEIASGDVQASGLIGTPSYISPERFMYDTYDSRADIYSLGVTFYEMLAGRLPYGGKGLGVLAQMVDQDPRPLIEVAPDVPEAVADLVMAMLARDPSERPPARLLVEQLQPLLTLPLEDQALTRG